ncbi:MAG: hypothetical protein ACHRXM_24520 [Isosphaerales bacterium]
MTSTSARLIRWMPAPGDLVFGVVLGMVLIGGRFGLLNDPGTPWHLRLGREILATRTVPHFDTLTYTHDHAAWVDQSWAFDVLLAVVVDRWGWSAAIALAALGLAGLYRAVTRGLIRDGIAPMVAVVVTLLAVAIGAIHFLIRPHLFTFAFVYLTLRACRQQHKDGGWAVFLVPIYTALLANLHGGFVALPLMVATAALGHVVSGPWDAARRRDLVKFGLACAACLLAALINPYGFGLYRHVGHLLVSSGVTSLIIEYQPPHFGTPDANVLEWVLLAMVGLPVLSSRRIDRYQLCHVLVWLHLALTSIRNAPLFALVAAPALATLIDGLPLVLRNAWKRTERAAFVPAAATIVLLVLVVSGVWLGGFDLKKWPFGALGTLNQQPVAARLFHEQDWGGLIAAECQPVRRSYLDDRFELFGKKAILEYVDVLSGGPVWDTVHDRDRIDLVWMRPDRGLAKRLLKDPGWTVIHRDKVSILFKQVTPGQLTAR